MDGRLTRRAAILRPLAAAGLGAAPRKCEEVRRIPAAEANQGVAADEEFLYAIANHAIGKYEKKTGAQLPRVEDAEKAAAAAVFYKRYVAARSHPEYVQLIGEHRERYEGKQA